MAALPCDQPNCSQPASVFGFAESQHKTKVCRQHMCLLTDQQLPVFDILAFHFIRKAEDAAVSDWTRARTPQGRALEVRCKGDLAELESRLQMAKASMLSAVERSFRDMEERAQQRYEATKEELTRRRTNLVSMVERGQVPTAEEIALWEEGTKSSLTDYFLGGPPPPPDSPLAAFCKVPPEERSPMQPFPPSTDCPKFTLPVFKPLPTPASPIFNPFPILTQLGPPPSLSSTEQQLQAAADSLLRAGLDAHRDLEKSIQQRSLESPELRLQLGLVLSHFVEKSDTDSVLRKSVDLNTSPELTLQLSNCLAEAYYQAGWWNETAEVCERTLQTWGKGGYGFELLRALYFLTCSLYSAGKTTQGLAVAREWTAKLPTDSATGKALLLFIQAEQHRVQGREEAAATCYESGLALKLLPQSYVTACSSRWLGLIYETQQRWKQAEAQLLQAKQIFVQVFPQSLDLANCLHNLGELYWLQERLNEAAESCSQACQIYCAHFPQSLEFANCLKDLGLVYENLERWGEAEERCLQACLIYSAHFPLCLDFATCLHCLGNLCKATQRLPLAEEHYLKACQVYATQFYQSTVCCLHQHF